MTITNAKDFMDVLEVLKADYPTRKSKRAAP
jgi:hypothetical protein